MLDTNSPQKIKLRHFKREEFACSFTGKNEMQNSFLLLLDELRERCGFPFHINSGYRDPSHPEERKKNKPGTHTEGIAADIRADASQQYRILLHGLALGFTGIGVGKTFIHVDTRKTQPVVWTYD